MYAVAWSGTRIKVYLVLWGSEASLAYIHSHCLNEGPCHPARSIG